MAALSLHANQPIDTDAIHTEPQPVLEDLTRISSYFVEVLAKSRNDRSEYEVE